MAPVTSWQGRAGYRHKSACWTHNPLIIMPSVEPNDIGRSARLSVAAFRGHSSYVIGVLGGPARRRRWPPLPSVTGKARLRGRRWHRPRPTTTLCCGRSPTWQVSLGAVCEAACPSGGKCVGHGPRLRGERARRARALQSTSRQAIPAGYEGTSRSAPKIGHRRSQNQTKRTAQAAMTTRQGADLRVCVELRGFEPLTPSMRSMATPSGAVARRRVTPASGHSAVAARRGMAGVAWGRCHLARHWLPDLFERGDVKDLDLVVGMIDRAGPRRHPRYLATAGADRFRSAVTRRSP
jgi:hypothetical protein